MKIHSLFVVAAVSILAASCTAGTSGIFASIEREQKVVSLGGMAKTATVTSMAELTNSSYTHQYFATGGQNLFSRAVGAVTWNKSTVGGNAQVVAVGSAGANGSESIYAVAGGQLYQYSPSSGQWGTVGGLAAGDSASDLIPIRESDGYSSYKLLLVTYNSSLSQPSYQNVYLLSGNFPSTTLTGPVSLSVSGVTGLAANVISAVVTGAADTPASAYYLASQSYLWQINAAFTTPTLVATSGGSIHGYQGLLYRGGTLYLSTLSRDSSGGGLYSTTLPTVSFSAIGGNSSVSLNNKAVWFTQFLYNTASNTIWVATSSTTLTEGTGYMELNGTTLYTTPNNTDSNNYGSTVLPSSAVGVLFADHETPINYFLGTDSEGLWLWNGTTTSPATWAQQ